MPVKSKAESKKKLEKPVLEKKVPLKQKGTHGGARENAGRPPFEPTEKERKQVELFSGYGIPYAQIGALIRDGIDADTVSKHFSRELLKGKAVANVKNNQTLFQQGQSGNTAALIFWAKTQGGFKEISTQQIEYPNGILTVNANAEDLTDEQLAAILKNGDE